MASTITSCSLYTLANVLVEVVVKVTTGQAHMGRSHSFVWMGATDNHLNPNMWLLYSLFISMALYALALVVYRVLKMRLRVDQAIVPASHNTRVESSANGMTNAAVVVAMVLLILYFVQTVLGRWVSFRTFPSKLTLLQYTYPKGEIVSMPMSGLLVHTGWNAICSSWLLWNREAHR